jgi:hypothetical protein
MRKSLMMVLLFLIALSAPAFAQSHWFFPQIAIGGGWSTDLYFTNQGTAAVAGIKISFYDDAGLALSIDSNLGPGTSYIFDLASGASRVIRITPSSTAVAGYAEVIYPANTFVRASEVYRYKPEGTVLAEVGVSQRGLFNNYSFPIEISSSKHLNTAIGLVNPSIPSVLDTAQTVVMTLIDSDGHVKGTATKVVEKGKHIAEYLNQNLFPDLDNFTGSISISCPFGVVLMALRQDNEAFGGISTDFGPVLGPFLLSGTAINEIEPNDDTARAQAITGSTIISGGIGVSQDFDFYAFVGKKGDIVSVVCEAQSIGSPIYMNPILGIYNLVKNDKGEFQLQLIGLNTDNGLTGSSDCFLQMALPANDKYYIVVYNYYTASGLDYLYRLHITLP